MLTGHGLLDDYHIELALDRNEIGFVHGGWDYYRKYFNDAGGYFPALLPAAPTLGENLYLDIGKAWVDVGLTLPDWPRLGGFRCIRACSKAGQRSRITSWGTGEIPAGPARGIFCRPAKASTKALHILKFDLDGDIAGITFEDRFRGEFYKLSTTSTNVGVSVSPPNLFDASLRESTTYFAGANTIRLGEKICSDWLSAVRRFSAQQAQRGFERGPGNPGAAAGVLSSASSGWSRISRLEKQSQVANVNTLIGPLAGFTLSGAAQSEWTRQHDFGTGTIEQTVLPAMFPANPAVLGSDYDPVGPRLTESAAVRFTKIPGRPVLWKGRLEQQRIDQADYLYSPQ